MSLSEPHNTRQASGAAIRLLALLSLAVFSVACGDNDKNPTGSKDIVVNTVRNGHFNNYQAKTVGALAECYFSRPRWESLTRTDGNTYVNLSGQISYIGNPVNALLQFRISGSSWEINSFEMNDIPQNALLTSGLVADIIDECG